jgi:SAM-dependent methyltransferase
VGGGTMELISIKSKQEFQNYISKHFHQRMAVEKLIADENLTNKSWELPGFCEFCNKAVKFKLDWFNYYDHPTLGKTPSYRERLVCPGCDLNNRQRFMASYLLDVVTSNINPVLDIYLYEQVTSFYRHVSSRLSQHNIIGSEYLGESFSSGEIVKNVRHEDALALSLKDESLDIIVSNDVYEHVPDIYKTFTEAYRVLRKNGKVLFSVPFQTSEVSTQKRAEINAGRIEHMLPERYHGNPVSEKGSLVFYDFGWDLLDMLKLAGFTNVHMLGYYSLMFGHIGNGIQYIFVGCKSMSLT